MQPHPHHTTPIPLPLHPPTHNHPPSHQITPPSHNHRPAHTIATTQLISICWMVWNIAPSWLVLHYTYAERRLLFPWLCRGLMVLVFTVGVAGVLFIWLLFPRAYSYATVLSMTQVWLCVWCCVCVCLRWFCCALVCGSCFVVPLLYLHLVSTSCIYILYLHLVSTSCIYILYLHLVSTRYIHALINAFAMSTHPPPPIPHSLPPPNTQLFYQSQASGILPPTVPSTITQWRGDSQLQDMAAPFLNPTGGLYNISLELLLGIGPQAVSGMVNSTLTGVNGTSTLKGLVGNGTSSLGGLLGNGTRRLLQEVG